MTITRERLSELLTAAGFNAFVAVTPEIERFAALVIDESRAEYLKWVGLDHAYAAGKLAGKRDAIADLPTAEEEVGQTRQSTT